MYSVTQRIKKGRVLLRDRWVKLPDIRFGDNDVLGKSSVRIDADNLHVLADVGFTSAALIAFAASHVHLR